MTDIRTGTKKSARERKNGASREEHAKRKFAANSSRPKQRTVVEDQTDGTTKTYRVRDGRE